MWQDLVKQQDKWIGGKLIDHGDPVDRAIFKEGTFPVETTITGFALTEHNFEVSGKEFGCGGSREHVGIGSKHVENGLALCGYGGHRFDIVKPRVEEAGVVRSLIIDTDVTVINNPSEPVVESCSDREKANK